MPAENLYCPDNFFKKMTDLDSPKKNNDCYFYYYSTCSKGDSCIFRHEPSALGCETMCSFWKEGKCFNIQCNFRHMELRKNRKAIPCYWESQPGGCLKVHCSFLHQNPRPVDAVNRSYIATDQSVGNLNNSERTVTVGEDLVVNFEEESDNEYMPYSPPKNRERICTVKTLEEIRLEKVQAESAAYYAYSDDSSAYSNQANTMRKRIFCRLQNKELVDGEVTQKRLSDSQIPSAFQKKRKIFFREEDGTLEIRINKRKDEFDTTAVPRFERIENNIYRRTNNARSLPLNVETNLEDIKIKTLDEIRRERKNKEETIVLPNDEQEVTSTCMDVDSKNENHSPSKNIGKKIVLNRNTSTDKTRNIVLSNNNQSITNYSAHSNVSTLGEFKVTQDKCETESTSSKLEESLLLEEDDLDDDAVILKAEDELLNEVDDCWED